MHLRSADKPDMTQPPTRFPPRRVPPLHIALGGLALSVVVNVALAIHVVSAVKQRDDSARKMLEAIKTLSTPPPAPDYSGSFKGVRDSISALADHQKQMTKALNDLTIEQSKFGEKLDKGKRR